ncbi:ATP-binding protein [Vibrio aquaticus]|uniref:ATP-binding protein n=1 Tax=Vibrio aquaticus TaxID=2496559 RepID=A0A432CYB3_9VIBR|nr:AAA family ATPase [Vibrio aquaticus]RTZ16870.1 ATP-binding protein [Vibrio aquaticus]
MIKDAIDSGIWLITGDNGAGKTRYLSQLASESLLHLNSAQENRSKLICLSGTVYEKFPKPNKELLTNIEKGYYYFGYKANNNMFSEITPFRMIISVLLNDEVSKNRFEYSSELLKDIGFGETIKLDFRWARNYKESKNHTLETVVVNLSQPEELNNSLRRYKSLVNEGKIHLNKIYFSKGEEYFSVTELSSGERLFVLIILSLCLSIDSNSIILFDEPENSMHPKWQEKVTRTICNIFVKFGVGSELFIATHSPLVVSSVPNNIGSIGDLNVGQLDWQKSNYSGNNADSILKTHFGMISARSKEFVLAFQKCISSMVNQEDDFNDCFRQLQELNVSLSENDPLYDAYESMLEYSEGLQ